MTRTSLLTTLSLSIMLAACGALGVEQDHPADGADASPAATDGGDAVPVYSRSGYNLTPLTKEEIDTILPTLTEEQIRITQNAGTEPAGCGNLTYNKEPGTYVSVIGGLPLFRSDAKFESKSGWASFFAPFDPDHILERVDRTSGMIRTEILDARSGAHLGHVFDDGPLPTGRRYCLNSAALTFIPDGQPLPETSRPVATKTAFFGGGCFWGIEDRLQKFPGVITVVSGYMGGNNNYTTYREICTGQTGHAEIVGVQYDPTVASYRDLVEKFFQSHDPTQLNRQGPDVGSQYRSAIFYGDEQEKEIAQSVIALLVAKNIFPGRAIVTDVSPRDTFHTAETSHQDYYERNGGTCHIPTFDFTLD
jgi:peptide methionine sulfoxide reductase msrA/msrB